LTCIRVSRLTAGIADHTGWAIFVSVSAKGGVPVIVDRRRVELIEPGLPKQPYEHETAGMNANEAERLVEEVRESAAHCAVRELSRLGETVSIALRAATLPRLPHSVAEARASWHMLARADGMLYHDALCTAAATLGIKVATFPRGEERRQAADAMGTTVERLDVFLDGLRERLGPPWQQDHKAAAARAIAATRWMRRP
jgi:hypothetical protein